jgi:putative intracellular protease/amidase
LLAAFQQQGKPMALVCHAPCALLNIKSPNGDPLIKGKHVTSFSNTEEAAVKLTQVVPFFAGRWIKKAGGHYSKEPDWGVYVQTDGFLITGQNPASSAEVAKALLKLLKNKTEKWLLSRRWLINMPWQKETDAGYVAKFLS